MKDELMKITVRDVRRSLAAAMDQRAMFMKKSREQMLRTLLEEEFKYEEANLLKLQRETGKIG